MTPISSWPNASDETHYSAQIVFFGAELTKVYSRRFGALVVLDAPGPLAAGARTRTVDEETSTARSGPRGFPAVRVTPPQIRG